MSWGEQFINLYKPLIKPCRKSGAEMIESLSERYSLFPAESGSMKGMRYFTAQLREMQERKLIPPEPVEPVCYRIGRDWRSRELYATAIVTAGRDLFFAFEPQNGLGYSLSAALNWQMIRERGLSAKEIRLKRCRPMVEMYALSLYYTTPASGEFYQEFWKYWRLNCDRLLRSGKSPIDKNLSE